MRHRLGRGTQIGRLPISVSVLVAPVELSLREVGSNLGDNSRADSASWSRKDLRHRSYNFRVRPLPKEGTKRTCEKYRLARAGPTRDDEAGTTG